MKNSVENRMTTWKIFLIMWRQNWKTKAKILRNIASREIEHRFIQLLGSLRERSEKTLGENYQTSNVRKYIRVKILIEKTHNKAVSMWFASVPKIQLACNSDLL